MTKGSSKASISNDSKRGADEDDERADERADEGADDEARSESEGEGNRDEAAARMAKALGVDGEDDKGGNAEGFGAGGSDPSDSDDGAEAADPDEPKAAANRAARRREQALARRKQRAGADAPAPAEGDATDKNKRAKALVERRRAAAQKDDEPVEAQEPTGLAAGEMVDDVLARTSARITRALRQNALAVQVVLGLAIVGVGVTAGVFYFQDKKAGAATGALALGTRAERGRILENDERSDDEKSFDAAAIYKTDAERATDALAAYAKVTSSYPGTGAAILARLGEAGVRLDQGEHDQAAAIYAEVIGSPLGKADGDVRGRATEGLGYAKEGKGDLDGALEAFRELQKIDVRPFKEAGQYHEGRVLLAKGEKDQAKAILQPLYEKVKLPGKEGLVAGEQLKQLVARTLRKIDPALAPAEAKGALGGARGGQLDMEELQRMLKASQDKAEQKAKESGDHEDHGK